VKVATLIVVLIVLVDLGTLVGCPTAEGQSRGRMPKVGIIAESDPPPAPDPFLAAFRQGLGELGYVEGQNVLLEIRWSQGVSGRQAALVSELVRVPVDVIVVTTTGATLVAKRATRTIPIVAASAGALVESGAVASLAQPGGNVTGITTNSTELSAKRLQLLKEALPNISRMAVLMSPFRSSPALGEHFLKQTEAAAQAERVHLQILRVENAADLPGAFQAARRDGAGAVIILGNPFFTVHASRVAQLALQHRLPLITGDPGVVEAGGLLAYEADLPDMWRRAARYVDRILKGAKPGDLPVEQPTKFRLVVNLRTAKALELTIPPSLMLRADQLIE
jgi:putative ABC transport system substrate-binding protein